MSENPTANQHHPHVVEITVNKRPVRIEGPRATGLEIKQAAIAQGVPIDLGFQLAELLESGKRKIVGDEDTVTVHKGSSFVATAADDNS